MFRAGVSYRLPCRDRLPGVTRGNQYRERPPRRQGGRNPRIPGAIGWYRRRLAPASAWRFLPFLDGIRKEPRTKLGMSRRIRDPGTSPPIVVIGAGAAGLVAAVFAAAGGRRTLLLERTRDGGRKILISGGGRCNVLPSVGREASYVTASSRNTLAKILRSWPLPEQRRFFEEEAGIPLALEEESGKLFPRSGRARDVRDGLVAMAARHGVETRFGVTVTDVAPSAGGTWRVRTDGAGEIQAGSVVLATGGLSVPSTGSDGTGLRIAAGLGLRVHELYPALTPLTDASGTHAHLAGVSLNVRLEAPTAVGRFESSGGFLFTHRGYSGPAVLNIAHLAVRSGRDGGERQRILAQWSGEDAAVWEARLQTPDGGQVATVLRRHLPHRLADTLLSEAGVPADRAVAQLRRAERMGLVELLARYPLPWTGDEGYKKAEVTGGGVALSEIVPATLECRSHPGLFLCGELLDSFGPIGGYNFAWAWATGRAAGRGAAAAAALRSAAGG